MSGTIGCAFDCGSEPRAERRRPRPRAERRRPPRAERRRPPRAPRRRPPRAPRRRPPCAPATTVGALATSARRRRRASTARTSRLRCVWRIALRMRTAARRVRLCQSVVRPIGEGPRIANDDRLGSADPTQSWTGAIGLSWKACSNRVVFFASPGEGGSDSAVDRACPSGRW
jgi:hypothetical protein